MSQSPWAPPFGEDPYTGAEQASDQITTSDFSVRVIVGTWLSSYVVALVITTIILGATGNINMAAGAEPKWFLGVSAISLWGPFLVGLLIVSNRFGSGNFAKDFFLSFRLIDLAGIPIGVVSQLLLVGLATWPFRVLFPEKFDPENVEKRARDLFDNAHGFWLVVLVVVVVFGAPIIEELVYRGFIHGHLRKNINELGALVIVAVWFAGVHLRIVEFPGLFVFALVLGTCFHLTKRLGMSVVAHVAFNATGLALVAYL